MSKMSCAKITKEAESLSKLLLCRADTASWLDAYDKKLLRDSGRVMDELSCLVKRISEEYLQICEEDCTGDSSAGIPSCPFYQWPDITDDGRAFPGGCELKGEGK